MEKLISRLALTELAPLVRKAHDADLLVESTYEEFQQDLEYAVAHADCPCRPGDGLKAFAGILRVQVLGGIVTSRFGAAAIAEARRESLRCFPGSRRTRCFSVSFFDG